MAHNDMITIPTGILPPSPFLMTGHERLHAGMLTKKNKIKKYFFGVLLAMRLIKCITYKAPACAAWMKKLDLIMSSVQNVAHKKLLKKKEKKKFNFLKLKTQCL